MSIDDRSFRKLGEIGKSGIVWSNGYIYDEFLAQLRGNGGIKIYREMADNDPTIGACLFALKQILREVRWTVKPSPKNVGDTKNVEFLKDCMKNMNHSWNDFINDVLSMLVYGWSFFEPVYERSHDGWYRWKKIALRAQGSYDHWEMTDGGSVLGMWQRPAPTYQLIFLPLKKCILFRTELAGDNPMGRSILRNAYRPWYFKKNLEEIEGIGVERDLAGVPYAKPPEGFDITSQDASVQNVISYTKKLLASIRRDEQDGIFVPPGWEIGLMSSPGQRQFDTTAIINRKSKEIATTVLAQFIMLGMERTGSYALAGEFTEMFYICCEGWADTIASTFNRYAVPRLFALNGVVNVPLPYITHVPSSIKRYKLKDISTYVSSLAGVGALEIDEDLQKYLKTYARLKEYEEVVD